MIELEDQHPWLDEIPELVKTQREHYRQGEIGLIPKRAEVLAWDDRFQPHLSSQMIYKDGLVTLTGEGFLPVNHFLGRRTVFFENPAVVDGTTYYLEVKGYGRNGRELWPYKHDEGDLWFGMFMDSAEREHYTPLRLRENGISNIQLPVALLRFPEADFVGYTRDELEKLLDVRMQKYFFTGVSRIREAARRLIPQAAAYRDEDYEQDTVREVLASRIADIVEKTYKQGGKKALSKLVRESGLDDELSGLTDERQAGYVIRAVKSPIRVGDLHDPVIVTDRNRIIATSMGRTVRHMLELGFLHMTPNPGNWTTAGELVDFEDVIRYPRDIEDMQENMRFHKKQTLQEYLRFIFGNGTIGYLTADFQQGFMGRETTTDEVTTEALSILEQLKAA